MPFVSLIVMLATEVWLREGRELTKSAMEPVKESVSKLKQSARDACTVRLIWDPDSELTMSVSKVVGNEKSRLFTVMAVRLRVLTCGGTDEMASGLS